MKLLGIILARKNSQRLKNKHHYVIQNKKMRLRVGSSDLVGFHFKIRHSYPIKSSLRSHIFFFENEKEKN